MRTRSFYKAAVLIILTFYIGCTHPRPTASTQAPQAGPALQATKSDIGFASQQKLREHYQKHGAEFGSITIEQYLLQAQTLRDRPAGGNVLEFTRSDGVTTRYDRDTGGFIAFNADGTIRTYFRPNNGESYFLRQRDRD